MPDEDWDTVGGFVFGTLGHVPAPGESVEHAGWCFAAEQVDGRRIRQVRLTALSGAADGQDGHAEDHDRSRSRSSARDASDRS